MAKKGRKSAYETIIKPNFPIISEMCRTHTEKQIAEAIGVSYATFLKYKAEKSEFSEILIKGRQNLVAELKGILISKAKGYEYTETKTTTDNTGKKEKVEITKHAAPDVAAINLLLKNYDKDNWANDPQTLELRKKELELREKQIEENKW